MGAWNEQYWADPEEITKTETERQALTQERMDIERQIIKLRNLRWSTERQKLVSKKIQIEMQLGEIKNRLKKARLLTNQDRAADYGIDANDPRLLLAKARSLIYALNKQLREHTGLPRNYGEGDSELLHAIEDYLSYSVTRPIGKLKFVNEQVEH